MRYRLFGQTGLRVAELFLGTMVLDEARECRRIVDAYADAGGNVLDTASAYGDGESMLGSIIDRRDRFVVGTKYTSSRDVRDPTPQATTARTSCFRWSRASDGCAPTTSTSYWVHIWDRHTPVEETMRARDDAVRAGKVLYVGISDAPAWIVARANTLAQ